MTIFIQKAFIGTQCQTLGWVLETNIQEGWDLEEKQTYKHIIITH